MQKTCLVKKFRDFFEGVQKTLGQKARAVDLLAAKQDQKLQTDVDVHPHLGELDLPPGDNDQDPKEEEPIDPEVEAAQVIFIFAMYRCVWLPYDMP